MCETMYNEEFKEYISSLGKYCRDYTFHGEYRLDFKFMEEPDRDDADGISTKFDIKVDHVYLYAVIRVYPDIFEEFKAGNFSRIGAFMLHEICHMFTRPIEDLFWWDVCSSQEKLYTQTCERQVERISHAILVNMNENWYLPENLKESK